MHKFAYYAPQTVKEAARILSKNGPNSKLLAGGTDLLVQIKEHVKGPAPDYVVSVKNIRELHDVKFSARAGLTIGAGATISETLATKGVQEHFPAIADGTAIIGSLQIQNIATIGGNLCNAAPSADSAPPLIAYGATALIAGPRATRTVALEDFFTGPGKTVLKPGELLVSIHVPTPPARSGCQYVRHTPRAQMDIAMVGVASFITLDRKGRVADARIVLGAVAPTPIRARQAEDSLRGQEPTADALRAAGDIAAREESPIGDVRGSAGYRRYMTSVLVQRTAQAALKQAMR
ncbi:MAG: xanthine dehydrogenase family protein subunit M [Chloroflexi bacterium]|nr:xanthine dehydrogenase family protein subunit M [Chloroflexota bacterium]